MRKHAIRIFLSAFAAAIVAPAANASQLIDRNASQIHLQVNGDGQALLTYRKGSAVKHVAAWGALNARPATSGQPQVKFKLDYSGRRWKGGACKAYAGPALPNLAAACTAPDGSFWAAQVFRQPLPDLGFTPWTAAQRAVWLELSHWTGAPATLEVQQDWLYGGKFREIYGRLTYQGQAVYGLKTTRYGVLIGGYGSLVYLDTLNAPAYGSGWRRENSFVTHKPSGAFCYGFYTYDPTKGGYQHPPGQTGKRGPGIGVTYRLTAHGPGVSPDVAWSGPAEAAYDPGNPADKAQEAAAVAQFNAWGDTSCLAGHSDF